MYKITKESPVITVDEYDVGEELIEVRSQINQTNLTEDEDDETKKALLSLKTKSTSNKLKTNKEKKRVKRLGSSISKFKQQATGQSKQRLVFSLKTFISFNVCILT